MPAKIEYSKDTWNEIFATISKSNLSTATICKNLKICFSTVWSQINKTKSLSKRYAQAKSEQSDYTVESSWDRIKAGYEFIKDPDQDARRLNAMVQMIRVELDNIKWVASKLKAKVYGDKLEQLIKGDKRAPLNIVINYPKKRDKIVSKQPQECNQANNA